MVVGVTYTALYSFLPHKEARFLFPAIPLFTLSAAAGVQRMVHRVAKAKPGVKQVLAVGILAALLASFSLTILTTICSSKNYPGGDALVRLNSLLKEREGGVVSSPVRVHIGNEAAISGVSRFLQLDVPWVAYSKVSIIVNVPHCTNESEICFSHLSFADPCSCPGGGPNTGRARGARV